MPTTPFQFKIASERDEFEQIHRLNYKTFVEEIPQHAINPEHLLIDKFHSENNYIICLSGRQVVGMAAVRDRRPFSLDSKLENLMSYLPSHRSMCEIRLLAVDKAYRTPRVFQGLMLQLAHYAGHRGYDLAVISGTVRQQKLYHHLGFTPFGPLVGTRDALYRPMYLTGKDFAAIKRRSRVFASDRMPSVAIAPPVNFLPGPVTISEAVRRAHNNLPASHRSEQFMAVFADTKRKLRTLFGASFVEIMQGSGTLANDVIAGQLSLLSMPGLLLSNGEFGDRLIDHATRFRLRFHEIRADWGCAFDYGAVQRVLDQHADIGWLWFVHCETSSGILNDLEALKKLTAKRGVLLCADCISSIGNVPVDLSGIYLASGTSSKGMGAYSGLSLVFSDHEVTPAPKNLPRYLDLGLYARHQGVPFTISSNLLYALHTALDQIVPDKLEAIRACSAQLKHKLRGLGLHLVGMEAPVSPAVLTIALPEPLQSRGIGDALQEAGYLVSYESHYLLERNWIQICLMGECNSRAIDPLLTALAHSLSPVTGK